MKRRACLAWIVASIVACSGDVPRPDASTSGADASSIDANRADLGPTDATATDAVAPDAEELRVGEFVELSVEGSRLSGELVYVYDQSRWWAEGTERTWALFSARAYAPYPDDRSYRFLDESKISNYSVVAAQSPDHRAFARLESLALRQSPLEGVAQIITGNESYHLDEDGRGDFAWDLVVTSSATGQRWVNDGFVNEDYLVFDRAIYLPSAGTVVEVVRDGLDNVPGVVPADAINNLVGVHLGGQYYLYILHFREQSIPEEITPGTWLPRGAYLGRAGNSGVTLEPHVHLTMLYFDEVTGRTWSVPSEFVNLYRSTNAQGGGLEPFVTPATGDWISSSPF